MTRAAVATAAHHPPRPGGAAGVPDDAAFLLQPVRTPERMRGVS
ncbi:hypothetical protein [Rhizosaccharibacter radicis]